MVLAAAWVAHCREDGIVPVPGKPDRDWYEQELFYAVGKTSTTECDRGRDYDRVMAHFEGLGRTGIKWQMKVHGGDFVRMQHELRKAVGAAADGVTEEYLRAVVRRMRTRVGRPVPAELPALKDVSKPELIAAMGEIKRALRREGKLPSGLPLEAMAMAKDEGRGMKDEVAAGDVAEDNVPF